MAASTAGAASGTMISGGPFGNIRNAIERAKERARAKRAAEAGGNAVIGDGTDDMVENTARVKTNAAADSMAAGAVAPHGDEAHTGGGNKRKRFGGVGSLMSGILYKMPASGAKYGNSPINKNFGDAEARGFKPSPEKMNTFGVGDSNKEKMSGVGSDLLDK